MKKIILVPINPKEELPKEDGKYIVELSPRVAIKTNYFVKWGWYTHEEVNIWYKELSEEEYLKEFVQWFWENEGGCRISENEEIINAYLKSKQ